MGILDSIKNLVTEQVEVPDEPIKIPKGVPEFKTVLQFNPIATTNTSSSVSVGNTAEIDESIKAKFNEALVNASPLYTELNDTVAMLAEDIPNISSRYKAAIKILGKRGATTATIISAFDSCLQVIDKRRTEFQAAAEKKLQEKVGGRQIEINGCDNVIKTNESNIQTLTAQIESLKGQIESISANKIKLQNEIAIEEQSIKLKQSRLEVVYKQLFDDFNTQKQNLLDYSK